MIQNIFSEELIQAVGWTMIHSLWQGFAVAILMGIAMIGLQKKSSKVRHEFAFFSLFLIFVISLSTFIYLYDSAVKGAALETTITIMAEGGFVLENATIVQSFFRKSIEYFNEHLPLIVTLWLMGMVFFLFRLLGGLIFIQELKIQQHQPLSSKWQTTFQKIHAKFPMKKTVRFVESGLAKTPMVIGYLKPIILFPLGTVNQLTQQEVEAVLAHELAHIYRNDYLLNIIQSFIEIIFYYHPAVWWISANIRTERENCCDDIAVKICGSSITYVKALVILDEIQPTPNLAMLFSSDSKNQLLNRVKRILNQPQNKFNIMEKFTATCFLLVALFLFSFSPTKFGANQANENSTKFEASSLDFGTVYGMDTFPIPPPPPLPSPYKDRYRKKGNGKFSYVKNGESVEVKYKDDEIVKLKINGEEIDEEDFSEYEKYIDELVDKIPLPPKIHTAAGLSNMNTATVDGTYIVTQSKDKNGNSVYILQPEDETSPVVIRGKTIMVDGETVNTESSSVVINKGSTISITGGGNINGLFEAVYPDNIPSGSIYIDGERSEWAHAFEAQLKEDGHVDSDGGFKFSMKENRLKINGDKQSRAGLEKYKSLYEKETGKSLGSDFKIEISTDGKSKRIVSVSISDDSN